MSDQEDPAEDFLQRWSRRKRAAGARMPDGMEPPRQQRADADASTPSGAAAQSQADLPAFDPATLPPIESITATSDIRAFLAPGVPEELTRAALRRVWTTDPAIRDFVGLAENQWDFTKPDSVPGFGSLELTPELRRMVAGLIGDAPGQATPEPRDDADLVEQTHEMSGELEQRRSASASSAIVANTERPHARPGTIAAADPSANAVPAIPQSSNRDVAPQKTFDEVPASPRSTHRKHGGAVPK